MGYRVLKILKAEFIGILTKVSKRAELFSAYYSYIPALQKKPVICSPASCIIMLLII